jgi:hypothetical protein
MQIIENSLPQHQRLRAKPKCQDRTSGKRDQTAILAAKMTIALSRISGS